MQASVMNDLFDLATTQGRPPPLVVITTYQGLTANKEVRLASQPFDHRLGCHETATGPGVSAIELLKRHQSRAIGTSWNGIIDHNGDFYSYVPIWTHLAWAQGISAVEERGWDSLQCKIRMYSLEVCGLNNGTPITREQTRAIIQFMWYADQFLGIPLADWRNRYFTHAEIGRFGPPPPFPHQRKGRKTDPRGWSPSQLAQQALGANPGDTPPTGVYKVTVSSQNANVRDQPHIGAPVVAQVPNGKPVTIVEWAHGDQVGATDWWGKRAEGGWMALAVLTLVNTTPTIPHTGRWFVNVSTRNANVRSDHRVQAPIVATLPNKTPVTIVEWVHGDPVTGVDWWGRRDVGGWMSITVLSSTDPGLSTTFTSRMAARATLLRAQVLPSWDANGPTVRCGLETDDDEGHDHQ